MEGWRRLPGAPCLFVGVVVPGLDELLSNVPAAEAARGGTFEGSGGDLDRRSAVPGGLADRARVVSIR